LNIWLIFESVYAHESLMVEGEELRKTASKILAGWKRTVLPVGPFSTKETAEADEIDCASL